MKAKVRVELFVEVDLDRIPDEPGGDGFVDDEDYARWMLEENGCPGTGSVGAILERHIAKQIERSACWACGHGATYLVELDGKPVVQRAPEKILHAILARGGT